MVEPTSIKEQAAKILDLASRRASERNTRESARSSRPDGLVAAEARRHVQGAGLPPRFQGACLSQFSEEVVALAQEFLSGAAQGLFIHGAVGTGKTHFAAAVLLEAVICDVRRRDEEERADPLAVPKLKPVRFITVPALLMEIRGAFQDGSGRVTEEDIVKKYTDSGILVLDDMGAEKMTEWVAQTLYLVVDRRYADLKRTIVTSNLSILEVAERIGDRIASRIAGMCQVIEIRGKDRRIEK